MGNKKSKTIIDINKNLINTSKTLNDKSKNLINEIKKNANLLTI